ncbi:MAG TPA: glycosyltransferase [Vicinamibacterales bacterium]|nr:glycosyltransferase [Vicinamibacterales bacterium]
MPAVSIIMPAYNVAPYIASAIRSALVQTYTDFELIVVDDGSKDNTAEIVKSLMREDGRIRLVQQANRGLAGARNTALRAARGEMLALLDSDDMWEPEFLGAQIAILDARPEVDIVTGNGWYLEGPRHGQLARPYPDPRPDPVLASIIGDEWSVFIMSVMRRRVYTAIGPFDEEMRSNEDYDFWLRAAIAGFTFARNDRPLGYYRVRSDSLSASNVRMLRGILHVYRKLGPVIAHRPAELAILEQQVSRFETELLAAEARLAIEIADFEAAREHLGALHARRGGAALGLAHFMARWAPGTLKRVLRFKKPRATVQPAPIKPLTP